MFVPSMPLAAARTSSRLRQNLTPPALPRPPAWIWALTIHCEPPRCLAASTAASGELATLPGGTAMPYLANSSLAWYSWKFIRYLERTGETCGRVQAVNGAHGEGGWIDCAGFTQYGRVFSRKAPRMERGAAALTVWRGPPPGFSLPQARLAAAAP